MPRPARKLASIRRVVRRRHRTWMLSMTFATLGWATWWLAVVLARLAPGLAPGFHPTWAVTMVFAGAGLCCGLFTLRAKLAWILITGVPLFANGSLLLLPLLIPEGSGILDPRAAESVEPAVESSAAGARSGDRVGDLDRLAELEHRQAGRGGQHGQQQHRPRHA